MTALRSGQLAHLMAGIEQQMQSRFREAIAHYDVVLEISDENKFARWNKATALLSLGDYTQGFPEHEVGWELFNWLGFGPVKEHIVRLKPLPRWHGEQGCKVIAYHQLGFGDAIQAFRYLPELLRRCDVDLVIDPCLTRLAQEFGVRTLDHVPEDLSVYDYALPFFGVMRALDQTIETIPNAPYIKRRFEPDGQIGIAWNGRSRKELTLPLFRELLGPIEAELCALQVGPPEDGVMPMQWPCDFSDVADRIAAMDHVITVDTAAAHLAGAMGHPSVHLVLPHVMDWRWWHSAVWYPTIKTYRQPDPDDWATPFKAVRAAIAAG